MIMEIFYVIRVKSINLQTVLIEILASGLEQKKILDVKSAKRKLTYVAKKKNRGSKDLNGLLYERFHGLKDRSNKKNIDCNVDLQYLHELWDKQKGLCALSGIPMTYYFDSGRVPTNLSVDRIDSSLGYIKGNIQLVCMAVNQMKSDLTVEQLKYFCKSILEYKKQ